MQTSQISDAPKVNLSSSSTTRAGNTSARHPTVTQPTDSTSRSTDGAFRALQQFVSTKLHSRTEAFRRLRVAIKDRNSQPVTFQTGMMIHDDVRQTMAPLRRHQQVHYWEVRNEQDPDIASRQISMSTATMVANTKGKIWGSAGADLMVIEGPEDHPEWILAPLEGNTKFSMGRSFYPEQVQAMTQETEIQIGRQVVKGHGQNSLTLVLASGSAKKPGKWAYEAFEIAMTAVSTPARSKFGSDNVSTIPYVPGEFQKLVADESKWAKSDASKFVGLGMGDMLEMPIGPDGVEVKNPDKDGKYELYLRGVKVNAAVGDGGISQLETRLSLALGHKVRISNSECLQVNHTKDIGTNKYIFLRGWNLFMKKFGEHYPFAMQRVDAYLAKTDDEAVSFAKTIFETPANEVGTKFKQPIYKGSDGRHGVANEIVRNPKEIESTLATLRTNLTGINIGDEAVAGDTICVTEVFTPARIKYEAGDKREVANDSPMEARFWSMGHGYDERSLSKNGGLAKRSTQWPEIKLTLPTMKGANQSTSDEDPNLITQPMNANGYKAAGVTQDIGDRACQMMTHLWGFLEANADYLQERDTSTSVHDPVPATEKVIYPSVPWIK